MICCPRSKNTLNLTRLPTRKLIALMSTETITKQIAGGQLVASNHETGAIEHQSHIKEKQCLSLIGVRNWGLTFSLSIIAFTLMAGQLTRHSTPKSTSTNFYEGRRARHIAKSDRDSI